MIIINNVGRVGRLGVCMYLVQKGDQVGKRASKQSGF